MGKGILKTGHGNSELDRFMSQTLSDMTNNIIAFANIHPGANLNKMLKGLMPSVKQLEKEGFSHREAVRIRTKLRRNLAPLYTFLKNPFPDKPKHNLPTDGGGDAYTRTHPQITASTIPTPNVTAYQAAMDGVNKTMTDTAASASVVGTTIVTNFDAGLSTGDVNVGTIISKLTTFSTDIANAIASTDDNALASATSIMTNFDNGWSYGEISQDTIVSKARLFSRDIRDALDTADNTAMASAQNVMSEFNSGLTSGDASMGSIYTKFQNFIGTTDKSGRTGGLRGILDSLAQHALVAGAKTAGGFSVGLFGIKGGNARAIGNAWAKSFNAALIGTLIKGLNIVGTMTIGHSPPKTGPLRHIDKGGKAIGNIWGKHMGIGMRESMLNEVAKTQHSLRRESLHMASGGVHVTSENHKTVHVTVDIKSSDHTANRKTQSEIRQGALKALSIDGIGHLITIGS